MSVKQTKVGEENAAFFNRLLQRVKDNEGEFWQFPLTGITVLAVPNFPGSEFVRVCLATCSITENRFRTGVGKFIAAKKWYEEGEFVRMNRHTFHVFMRGLTEAEDNAAAKFDSRSFFD